jgi:cell division septum initiation protein DivIVA
MYRILNEDDYEIIVRKVKSLKETIERLEQKVASYQRTLGSLDVEKEFCESAIKTWGETNDK